MCIRDRAYTHRCGVEITAAQAESRLRSCEGWFSAVYLNLHALAERGSLLLSLIHISATQKALKKFNPLFTLNYSATHAKQHNLIYVLDALDAYNKRLVKKIAVSYTHLRLMLKIPRSSSTL